MHQQNTSSQRQGVNMNKFRELNNLGRHRDTQYWITRINVASNFAFGERKVEKRGERTREPKAHIHKVSMPVCLEGSITPKNDEIWVMAPPGRLNNVSMFRMFKNSWKHQDMGYRVA